MDSDHRRILPLLAVMVACGGGGGGNGREPSKTGAPCEWNAECEGSLCIPADYNGAPTGWTGGMCSRACPDATCPDGEVCAELTDGTYCVPVCSHPGVAGPDCRDDYVCNTVIKGCLPDCRLGWDCGAPYECSDTGECKPVQVEPSPVGAPCETDDQCASGACIPETVDGQATGFKGGTCVAPCGPAGCPLGSACVPLGDRPTCLPGCTGPKNCREGYVCDPAVHVCLPDCRLGWDCGPGRECGEAGACEPVPPQKKPLGAPCAAAEECASATCLLPRAMGRRAPPAGQTGLCSVPCDTTACPPGATCEQMGPNRFCFVECLAPEACPPGTVCDLQRRACWPDCRAGWPCPPKAPCGTDGFCAGGRGGR